MNTRNFAFLKLAKLKKKSATHSRKLFWSYEKLRREHSLAEILLAQNPQTDGPNHTCICRNDSMQEKFGQCHNRFTQRNFLFEILAIRFQFSLFWTRKDRKYCRYACREAQTLANESSTDHNYDSRTSNIAQKFKNSGRRVLRQMLTSVEAEKETRGKPGISVPTRSADLKHCRKNQNYLNRITPWES